MRDVANRRRFQRAPSTRSLHRRRGSARRGSRGADSLSHQLVDAERIVVAQLLAGQPFGLGRPEQKADVAAAPELHVLLPGNGSLILRLKLTLKIYPVRATLCDICSPGCALFA